MMDWDGHMTTGGWIISIIWMLIVIALVVWLIIWLQSSRSRSGLSGSAASPNEILDRRLASGELSIEEYERLATALEGRSKEPEQVDDDIVNAPG
jgi:putative membrane protein